jgi:SWI/SNF-related matrix-associated actin-dependent regulator of chromatin subfamily A3
MGRFGYGGGGGYGRGGYGGYKKKSWGGGGGGYTKKKETAPVISAGSGAKRKASAPAVEDLADGADDADIEEDGGMDSYFDDNCIEVLTFRTKCVGCRFYDGIVHPGEFVQLKREPENQYDSNAIRVDSIDGVKVGHVAAKTGDAGLLAPLMDSPTTKVAIDAVAPEEKGYYEMPLVLKIFALPEDEEKVLKLLGRGSSSSSSSSSSGGKKSGAARIKAETVAEKESKAKAEMEKIYGDIQKKLDAVPVVNPPDALFTKLLPHQV